MKESVFTGEIMHSLKHDGLWAWKIPDEQKSKGFNTGMAFEKPCDIFTGMKEVKGSILIETKQMKKFRAFSLNDMRPSQIKHLSEAAEKGLRAFVFLNVRIVAHGAQKRENRLIVWEWAPLHERLKVSSIKQKEIMALKYTVKSPPIKVSQYRSVDGVFDLSEFYDLLNKEVITREDF